MMSISGKITADQLRDITLAIRQLGLSKQHLRAADLVSEIKLRLLSAAEGSEGEVPEGADDAVKKAETLDVVKTAKTAAAANAEKSTQMVVTANTAKSVKMAAAATAVKASDLTNAAAAAELAASAEAETLAAEAAVRAAETAEAEACAAETAADARAADVPTYRALQRRCGTSGVSGKESVIRE